ncbi:MAG: DNA-methyltransferase [bacterium]
MLEINNVYYGDCLDLMRSIDDNSIDLILCDLPYGTTQCKWDENISFKELWREYKRIIKNNRAIVLMASQPFTSTLIMSNIDMFKYCWVWNKRKGGNPLLSKIQPIKVTEDIVVFGKGKILYKPIMEKRDKIKVRGKNRGVISETNNNIFFDKDKRYTHKYPKNIINISNANQRNRLHPTQKPVELFEYLIRTYTNEGDLVLDNCAGSGTTGIACMNLNRKYILIEKDKKYIDIIKKRIYNNRYFKF